MKTSEPDSDCRAAKALKTKTDAKSITIPQIDKEPLVALDGHRVPRYDGSVADRDIVENLTAKEFIMFDEIYNSLLDLFSIGAPESDNTEFAATRSDKRRRKKRSAHTVSQKASEALVTTLGSAAPRRRTATGPILLPPRLKQNHSCWISLTFYALSFIITVYHFLVSYVVYPLRCFYLIVVAVLFLSFPCSSFSSCTYNCQLIISHLNSSHSRELTHLRF